MRNHDFVTGEFYHIYNRGVDKRTIFFKNADRFKFFSKISQHQTEHEAVDIICYCLMDNHFHFLLREKTEGGIVKFMQCLGNSYTKFFNARYQRSGRLFESTYKSKYVESNAYLVHLSKYINNNPLELPGITMKNLQDYPWSSLQYYLTGIKNHKFDIVTEPIMSQFKDTQDYQDYINDDYLTLNVDL